MSAAFRPPVDDTTNNLLRLQAVAARLPEGDADRVWLHNAVRRVLIEGCPLDEALGVTARGWASPRQEVRLDRRDDLLRRLYLAHYPGISVRAAAMQIITDHARLHARLGGLRPDPDALPSEPIGARDYHYRLLAEHHVLPSLRQLQTILRRAVILPACDLAPIEIAHGPDAASPDAA